MFVTNFVNLKDVLKKILLAIKKEKLHKNIIFLAQLVHHLIVLKILNIEVFILIN